MKYLKNILLLLFALIPAASFSQVVVNAQIDSVQILIGNQTNLRLTVAQPEEVFVQFPLFGETIVDGVEIITRHEPDTTILGNHRIEITQDFTVAVFDSGLFFMPPFEFVVLEDTLTSNSLTMRGFTIPVDLENKNLRDIKPLLSIPLTWGDIARILVWIFLILLLLAAIVYVFYRLKNNKSILPEKKQKEAPPPHLAALEGLNKLKNEKLWQQGREKEFHTELTDIIRTYIEKRFNVNAMELTSDEILHYMSKTKEAKPVFEQLKQILEVADLVKFAKMKLLPNENELSLSNSYLFVNETKIVPEEDNKED